MPWIDDDYYERTVTVGELVKALQALPQEANVWMIYDGFCRVAPAQMWVARGGHVVIVDDGDVVYRDKDRPPDAPPEKEETSWHAPKSPQPGRET